MAEILRVGGKSRMIWLDRYVEAYLEDFCRSC